MSGGISRTLTKQPPYRAAATGTNPRISMKCTSLGCRLFLAGGPLQVPEWQISDFLCEAVWQSRHRVLAGVVASGIHATYVVE